MQPPSKSLLVNIRVACYELLRRQVMVIPEHLKRFQQLQTLPQLAIQNVNGWMLTESPECTHRSSAKGRQDDTFALRNHN